MAQRNPDNTRGVGDGRRCRPDPEQSITANIPKKTTHPLVVEPFYYMPNAIEYLTLGVPDVVVDAANNLMPSLEEAWFQRKSRGEAMRSMIFHHLNSSQYPFWATLQVCASCSDFSKVNRGNHKEVLAFYVVQTFGEWLDFKAPDKSSPIENVEQQCQSAAFTVAASQSCQELLELVCSLYQLADAHDIGLPFLSNWLIEHKKYVQACRFVVALRWQRRLPVADVLVPLYMLDRYDLVNHYLKNDRETQVALVKFLDQFCHNDSRAAVQALMAAHGVTGSKREKMEARNLAKAVNKLAKKYGVAKEHMPNIIERQEMGALFYIMIRYFQQNAIAEQDFEDMLVDHVADNRKLQREAISLLASRNDMARAVRLARKWSLPSESLPPRVLENLDRFPDTGDDLPSSPPEVQEQARDRDGNSILCYSPEFDIEDIIFVDTVEKFENCVNDIATNADVVGIDMEWKPVMNTNQETRLALMQLAFRKRIYLVDFLVLTQVLEPRHYLLLVDYLFGNPDIMKVGFSLKGDWKMLSGVHQTLRDVNVIVENLCDLMVLCEKILTNHPRIFRHYDGNVPQGRSLAVFVELGLGVTLDKTQQFSNWERRPLLSVQTVYAAKDAYVLLDLLQSIKDGCQRRDIDFESLSGLSETGSSPPARGGGEKGRGDSGRGNRGGGASGGRGQAVQISLCRTTNDKRHSYLPNFDSNDPSKSENKPSFVVDNMLQGLGRQLRNLGLDTLILENDDYHTDVAKASLNDRRIVLSSGAPCKLISSMVPEGMCYSVQNGSAKEQAVAVLKYFNIKIRLENLFGRCQICNGEVYVEIPKEKFLPQMQASDSSGGGRRENPQAVNNIVEMDNGVKIDISAVSKVAFDKVDIFNVCYTCGKVYWEGSHRGRLFSSLCDLMDA